MYLAVPDFGCLLVLQGVSVELLCGFAALGLDVDVCCSGYHRSAICTLSDPFCCFWFIGGLRYSDGSLHSAQRGILWMLPEWMILFSSIWTLGSFVPFYKTETVVTVDIIRTQETRFDSQIKGFIEVRNSQSEQRTPSLRVLPFLYFSSYVIWPVTARKHFFENIYIRSLQPFGNSKFFSGKPMRPLCPTFACGPRFPFGKKFVPGNAHITNTF